MTTKQKHGGARVGAGRKTKDGVETKRYQVGLDDITVAKARIMGDGDMSLGIRAAFRQLAADSQAQKKP